MNLGAEPLVAEAAVTAFVIALVASLILTPLVRRLAVQREWLDRPDGVRKLHSYPIPTLGGLAVFGAFAVGFLALLALVPELLDQSPGGASAYLHLALAGAIVTLVGAVDDTRRVRPAVKILVQAACGAYLFAYGFRIVSVSNPFGDPIPLGTMGLPVTVLWFVAMSNALNLVDGLDGLAAGIGLVASVSLLAAALLNDRVATVVISAVLAGALLGFLRHNFNPARIFLGDSGSLFVGFILAGLAIHGFMKRSAAIALAAPMLVLALPMADVALAVARRFIRGKHIFGADRDHIHHRLLRLGLTPRRAVVSLYAIAALCATLSLVAMTGPRQVLWAVVIIVVLGAWAGMRRLGYVEFSELQHTMIRHFMPSRRVLSHNVSLHQLGVDLRRAASVPDLWQAVVRSAEELGFIRLELRLADDVHDGRPAVPAASSLVWVNGHRLEGRTWTWTIGLRHGATVLGEIVATRSVDGSALDFDAAYLSEVLATDLATGLHQVLAASHSVALSGAPAAAGSAPLRALFEPPST